MYRNLVKAASAKYLKLVFPGTKKSVSLEQTHWQVPQGMIYRGEIYSLMIIRTSMPALAVLENGRPSCLLAGLWVVVEPRAQVI